MSDVTELVIVLDRSGSMEARRSDHEGGLRSFLRDQRRLAGEVLVTLVRFDSEDPFELVLDAAPLADVDEGKLELVPRGGTPLLDAVGKTLEHVQARHAARAACAPGQTIVMVITDGQENASRLYSKARIQELVKGRQAAGWAVLYLGANVDEFAEAASIGVDGAMSLGYAATAGGTQAMYSSLVSNVSNARMFRLKGMAADQLMASLNFTQVQRTAAKAPDEEPAG